MSANNALMVVNVNDVLMAASFIIWTAAAFVWGMVYHRDYYKGSRANHDRSGNE